MNLKDLDLLRDEIDRKKGECLTEFRDDPQNHNKIIQFAFAAACFDEIDSTCACIKNILEMCVASHENKLPNYILKEALYEDAQEWINDKNDPAYTDVYKNMTDELESLEQFHCNRMTHGLKVFIKTLTSAIPSEKTRGFFMEPWEEVAYVDRIRRAARETLELYDLLLIKLDGLICAKSPMIEIYNIIMFGDFHIDNPIEPIENLYWQNSYCEGPVVLDGNNRQIKTP